MAYATFSTLMSQCVLEPLSPLSVYRFRQGFLSVFYFFIRIPRNEGGNGAVQGETMPMNALNAQSNAAASANHASLMPPAAAGSNSRRRSSDMNTTTVNDTTVRFNGNATRTSIVSTSKNNTKVEAVAIEKEKIPPKVDL